MKIKNEVDDMLPKNLENLRTRENNRNWQIPSYAIVGGLQRQVANAFNLYLNYKYYHWQSNQPLYRDLYIIFDEFAAETYRTMDKLGERIRAIGQKRVRLIDFPLTATVKPAEKETSARRMLEEASFNELIMIQEMYETIKKSKKNDPVSANVLSKLVKRHEKHHWWLRYILEKREWLFE